MLECIGGAETLRILENERLKAYGNVTRNHLEKVSDELP